MKDWSAESDVSGTRRDRHVPPELHHLDAHFDTKPGEVGQRVRMGVFACCGGFLAVGGSCGGLLGRERDTGRAAAV